MDKMVEAIPGASETAIKRFKAAALGVAMSPLIHDCTPESVFTAIYTCARLNLIPDPVLKHAYIIPFKEKGVKKAQLIIGYQGYIELARRANPKLIIRTGSVFENDEYELVDGMDLIFKITKRAWEKGQPNGLFLFSYCVSGTSGEEKVVKVISRQDGMRIAGSKSDYTPWKKGGPLKDTGVAVDFPAMCEKTAIRASSKLWSLDPEKDETKRFMEALAADENEEKPEVGDLNEYGLGDMGGSDDAGAPPQAPDAGEVPIGKVRAGQVKRRPTDVEWQRLWKVVGDKLQDANIEPKADHCQLVLVGVNTKKVPNEEATIDDLLGWAATISSLDSAKLAEMFR